jgi:hypothetical protein
MQWRYAHIIGELKHNVIYKILGKVQENDNEKLYERDMWPSYTNDIKNENKNCRIWYKFLLISSVST